MSAKRSIRKRSHAALIPHPHLGLPAAAAPRLSIVIASWGDAAALEETLVSVLTHRPPRCEVVVALATAYDDPYQLEGEVHFVRLPARSGPVECVNAGIAASRAPLIHLLAAGALVEDGWCDAALAEMCDPRVACVVPPVSDLAGKRLLAAGVAYAAGGRRRLVEQGRQIDELAARALVCEGASLVAAFYRRLPLERLAALREGAYFDPALGHELAELDLALELKALGLRAAVLTQSPVRFAHWPCRPARGWKSGRQAERIYLRHAAAGAPGTATGHLLAAVGELATGCLRPSTWMRALGRLCERLTGGAARDHHTRLLLLRSQGEAELDQPHGARAALRPAASRAA